MARDAMPILGKSRRPSWQRPVVAGVTLGAALGTLVLWRRAHRPAPPPPPVVAAPAQVAAAPAPPPPAPPPPRPEDALKKAGYRRVTATIDGPLETALVGKVGRELGQPLTQVIVREIVWWIEVPAGLRKGDQLDVLVVDNGDKGGDPGGDPVLAALRFTSGKTGQTHRAYRFRAPGAPFPRYYDADGQELELHLKDGPIEGYEQVTSLLRDGRGHQGVDFKTPVGTKVVAPFDGTIGRRNWNFRGNGNSLELKESGGRHRTALFLHLSELSPEAKPGASVQKGQLLALSGNTGHSFAPHLHYQLMSADHKVLDPFASHETERRALPASDRAAFDAEVRRLEALFALPLAQNEPTGVR